MPNFVTPEDYILGAPERITGTETECDIQTPPDGWLNEISLLYASTLDRAGLRSTYYKQGGTIWLSNGGSLHPDRANIVEYSSFESISRRVAAAGNLGSMRLVGRLCEAQGNAELYQHSGTMIDDRISTLGNQHSSMTPLLAATEGLAGVIDADQATRVWAWAGMVGLSGYELSQKARGIGTPTLYATPNRTQEGSKPMGWIRLNDKDVFTEHGAWARSERRTQDIGFSRWAAYMNEVTNSLVHRFSEHSRVFNKKDHPFKTLPFVDPVDVLHSVSQDLTLSQAYVTKEGKTRTAIDTQRLIAKYGHYLRERVELPQEEFDGVDMLDDICDRLDRVDMPNGDVNSILYHVDFAPRFKYLLKHFGDIKRLHSRNHDAVARSLLWDRAYPSGPGLRFWDTRYARGEAPDPIGDALIDYHTTHPDPKTRSAIRGAIAANPITRWHIKEMSWPSISFSGVKSGPDKVDLRPDQYDIHSVDMRLVRQAFKF